MSGTAAGGTSTSTSLSFLLYKLFDFFKKCNKFNNYNTNLDRTSVSISVDATNNKDNDDEKGKFFGKAYEYLVFSKYKQFAQKCFLHCCKATLRYCSQIQSANQNNGGLRGFFCRLYLVLRETNCLKNCSFQQ